MFESQQRSTGTQFTTTVALLVLAFIFSPVALFFSRPVGLASLSRAMGFTVVCAALARLSWKRYSELNMTSLAIAKVRPN